MLRESMSAAAAPDVPARSARLPWRWRAVVAVVVVAAFVIRLVPMLRGGGLSGSDGYDDGVYFSAATALVHGRLPYRDFVLLHPPGLVLALTPFAGLAQLISDRTGQEVARLSFMALGALHTALMMKIGFRYGRAAGLVAGVAYATFFPSLSSERTTTLEALGTTTVLVALTLLVHPERWRVGHATGRWGRATWRWTPPVLVGAGAALGLGTGVKIWGIVALVVFAGWVLVAAGWRAVTWLVGSAGVVVVAICLPFFAQAPAAMWRYVVLDQLGRPRSKATIPERLMRISSVDVAAHDYPHWVNVAFVAVLVVFVVAVVAAVRQPGGPVLLALMVAESGVLLASPNLYQHYVCLAAPAGILLVALGANALDRRLRTAGRVGVARAGLVIALVGIVVYGIPGMQVTQGKPLSSALAVAAVRTTGCVTADDPTYLIAMNVLSRNFAEGCPVWIDPTGIALDHAGGAAIPYDRADNPAWQQLFMDYLLSGRTTMVERRSSHLGKAELARIEALPVIAESHGFQLRTVR